MQGNLESSIGVGNDATLFVLFKLYIQSDRKGIRGLTKRNPSDFKVIDFSDYTAEEATFLHEILELSPTPAEVYHIEAEIKKITDFIKGVKK